ncbi:MAG TPA: hypothetical protein VJ548_10075 [Azospira sp.]|nr:hypothetical protein [Azospira sp.]
MLLWLLWLFPLVVRKKKPLPPLRLPLLPLPLPLLLKLPSPLKLLLLLLLPPLKLPSPLKPLLLPLLKLPRSKFYFSAREEADRQVGFFVFVLFHESEKTLIPSRTAAPSPLPHLSFIYSAPASG